MEPSSLYCRGVKGGACFCPRGKGLGGSTLINAMVYLRSTRYDHQQWVNKGNLGWDYDSVAEHYRNFENVQTDEDDYGKKGELKISSNMFTKSLVKSLPNLYKEMGMGVYTENTPIGFHNGFMTISNGTRQNSAKAFLANAKNRSNLFVAVNAQVGQLLFNKEKTSVTGVNVKIGNVLLQIKATKETILSAGSINSPQILMNSGIGPKHHLSNLGIEVIRNLKVGENLQDHFMFPVICAKIGAHDLGPKPPFSLLEDLYQYLIHKKGHLEYLDAMAIGYINTQNKTDRANIQIMHLAIHQQEKYLNNYFKRLGIPDEVQKTILQHNKKSSIMISMPILLNPKSTGNIRLQSRDPFDKPIITPNYLSDANSKDLKVMISAIRMVRQMTNTKTLAQFSPKLIELELLDCQEFVVDSDDYWECFLRNLGQSIFHPVGTCKMGPASDPTAVVDPHLKVHGIGGVRVIDGSIMPTITSGNTNAPIMMIAEKSFQLIKEEWLYAKDEL